MPNLLNFKDWKVASSDGDRATLKHSSGHTMTIAMKAIPKLQREQIMRMAKIQTFDDGSPATVQSDDSQPQDSQADRTPTAQPAQPAPPVKIEINNGGQPQGSSPPQPVTPPQQNPAAVYAAQNVNANPPNISTGRGGVYGVPNLDANGTMNPAAVAQNSQEAEQNKAKIAAAQAQDTIPIEQGYTKGIGQVQQNAQENLNEVAGHVNDFRDYIKNNPINPNAYWQNKNGGQKTLSGLGLILGGMGAGMLGSVDNPALRFVNAQIDRDIQAQQSNVNNRHTLLGAYQQLYGEGVAANAATKASMLDIRDQQLKQLALKYGTPQAMANYQAIAPQIAIERSKALQEAAVNLNSLPGTKGTSSDVGAMNTPRGRGGSANPGNFGQQGPTTAGNSQSGGMTTADLQAMHEKQGNSSMQSGLPGSASGLEEGQSSKLGGESRNNSQLKDNSGNTLKTLQKFDLFAKNPSRADDLQKQHDQQIKTDEQLKQVDGIYDKLFSETNGLSGRIHRGINPHAIAGVLGALGTGVGAIGGAAATGPLAGLGALAGGTALGSAAAGTGEGIGHSLQTLTNTESNQRYDTDLESLKGFISAALPGRTTEFVNEAAEKYAPTSQDSKESAIKKREALKQFIVDHAGNGALRQYGLLKS